ncbi:UV DNA damage endonuclease [Clostridium polyendosporum]|uniref:UV DNA damage endonuclease n=1 Tax=Clostridium polyendosporum TaxID=69208 RepID=A0A919RXD3_9CLOT|nr:UV DNA damage repair endonuclease UvsE [Clostridium polyendosporum]GIM28029.1 UV DNA damage endonuclease [Clostridium polyendosporum]
MQVRLGYVAIALNLPKVTSSSTVTYSNYNKLLSMEKKIEKLKAVTLSNLDDLYTILKYTIENQIHFYRITSALVPLCTHPEVMWDYRKIFRKDFQRIGAFIKQHNMRVDTHPDEFNVLNSNRDEVVENTIRNLWFHAHFFEDMEYSEGKMVMHVGGGVGGKEKALERFKANFNKTPQEISSRIIIENDDKTFTTKEVLELCKDLSIPMVLDVHHHICNNNGEKLTDLLGEIFQTWEGESLPPKIHFSSPREGEKDRKHADYIEAESFIRFLDIAKELGMDFDIMLEAKMKDLALFKLTEDIKNLRPRWRWIDNSTLIIT